MPRVVLMVTAFASRRRAFWRKSRMSVISFGIFLKQRFYDLRRWRVTACFGGALSRSAALVSLWRRRPGGARDRPAAAERQ